jgi:HD-like signal output (HDOD) protein
MSEAEELQKQLDELYDSLPELPDSVMSIIQAIVDTEIQLEALCNQ